MTHVFHSNLSSDFLTKCNNWELHLDFENVFVFRFTIREQFKDNGIMSELGISPVYRHDTGFFKCIGSNYYGQDENSIELIVQGNNGLGRKLFENCKPISYFCFKFITPFE